MAPPRKRKLLPVQALTHGLFDHPVVVEEVDPRQNDEEPRADEAAMVRKAIARRRRQFAAGRACAHRALARLGVEHFSLLNGEDRAPIWPAGIIGTLTHTDHFAAVAVARADEVRALGLDVEPDEPLNPDILHRICFEEERAWLATLPEEESLRVAKLIFSAKESAYKAQYAITRTYLGFEAMQVKVELEARTFEAAFTRDVGPFTEGHVLAGRFVRAEGYLLTAVTLVDAP